MRQDQRSPVLSLLLLFGTFFVGGLAGWGLATWLAPGSGFALGISGMLLPFAWLAGTIIWLGTLAWRAPVIWWRRLRGGGALAAAGEATIGDGEIRRSARVFVPVAAAVNLVGGFVVGLVPGGGGVLSTAGIYGLVGYAYGHLLWLLAERGHLRLEE